MKRFFVDCRDIPSDINCSGAIFANTKEELVEMVVQHRVRVHKKKDSEGLRESVFKDIKEAPPLLRMHRL